MPLDAGISALGENPSLTLAQIPNDPLVRKMDSPDRSSQSDMLTYHWHGFWKAGQLPRACRLVASRSQSYDTEIMN